METRLENLDRIVNNQDVKIEKQQQQIGRLKQYIENQRMRNEDLQRELANLKENSQFEKRYYINLELNHSKSMV